MALASRANRSYFSDVFLRSVPSRPVDMDLPAVSSRLGAAESSLRSDCEEEDECPPSPRGTVAAPANSRDSAFLPLNLSVRPLSTAGTATASGEVLFTLSALPRARWHNLSVLDVVRVRFQLVVIQSRLVSSS